MKEAFTTAAAAAIAPTLLKRFKFRYVVFGLAAYYGLRMLSKKGMLPKPAEDALDLIDHGIDMAKEKVGLPHKEVATSAAIH